VAVAAVVAVAVAMEAGVIGCVMSQPLFT
jgi:hypothetical protein